MKYIVPSLLLAQAAAFTMVAQQPSMQTRLYAGDYEPMEGEGKINLKVDLDSPKVATMDEIEKGKKVYCRCWLSGTFPLCDASHVKHNAATGDNVGPLIVSVKKD
jgi:CDGSH-type Zn-finger protein